MTLIPNRYQMEANKIHQSLMNEINRLTKLNKLLIDNVNNIPSIKDASQIECRKYKYDDQSWIVGAEYMHETIKNRFTEILESFELDNSDNIKNGEEFFDFDE